MEFIVIKNIGDEEFKRYLIEMVGEKRELNFTSGAIKQSYNCDPLVISATPKKSYLKVQTCLENGWSFLQHVIRVKKFNAMQIRYEKDQIAEFSYWETGSLKRMQHALRDSRWVWFGKGNIQSWEEESQYENRMIKKRLTSEMLESYLRNLGYQEAVN